MFDGNVYYCWSCDAHRKVRPDHAGRAACPCCQRELSDDDRVTRRTHQAPPISTAEHTAPALPARRLAASA